MRIVNVFLLCIAFWLAAAASFSGYIGKYGFLEATPRAGIEVMLNGHAFKPFVYRQFAPIIARIVTVNTPRSIRDGIVSRVQPTYGYSMLAGNHSNKEKLQYIIIYYLNFFLLFCSLFILRSILLGFQCSYITSILAPILVVLCIPYVQTVAGYFYDNIELFFMSLAFLSAFRGKYILLLCLIIPATLNKESFLFFLPTLYPIIRHTFCIKKSIYILSIAMFLSGITNLIVKKIYVANAGGLIEYHLWDNIVAYSKYSFYFLKETTYSVISPAGFSIVYIVIVVTLFTQIWGKLAENLKQHILIVSCINLPLFFLFCGPGELRNLSFFYVSMTLLVGAVIDDKNASKSV
ncbi:unnamed protein product [Commensalibacter communis]|uniref:hypothetical protein n=1 Tax=Commensalibacter communis TaxID=2972786 RepID=UPI0022FF9D8A|nr:hypothetical protein [Commensalibacter communis]CAI3937024.1 unnamed protein product [Commensalibacter communis]CAI3938229.1 unnamed protein product [Commensalibacter communis]